LDENKNSDVEVPNFRLFMIILEGNEVVGWAGLEPATNGLKGRCSTD
jgi:hypothetical protein